MIRILVVFLFIFRAALGQNPDVGRYVAEAHKAAVNKDYAAAYDHLIKAHTYHPHHQGILYQLGVMSALTGKPNESIPYLRKAKGIDGLLYDKGALIALQNGTFPFRVVRFQLNKSLDTITGAEILDQAVRN